MRRRESSTFKKQPRRSSKEERRDDAHSRAGARACHWCIRRGGLQARANLNGGELDEGPILPDGEPGARCVMGMI